MSAGPVRLLHRVGLMPQYLPAPRGCNFLFHKIDRQPAKLGLERVLFNVMNGRPAVMAH